jgi:hypothetical protein
MPRLLFLCVTIVAAFQLRLAAATPPIAHVPVTPAVAALAERLGMDLDRDRGRFVAEIIRRIYSPPPSRQSPLNLNAAARDGAGRASGLVDVPLAPESWNAAVFRHQVPFDQLLASILVDRRAALLCRGLGAADDETLAFYAEHPALLTHIYERAAPAFAAFGGSIQVHDGHIAVPGGDAARVIWEKALALRLDDPESFIRTLFLDPEARSAYLFDVLATASPQGRAFALGLWIDDEALRIRRFQALDVLVHSTFREWRVEQLPFARPLNDLALLLLRVQVDDRGEPAAPAQRRFWALALDANPSIDAPADSVPATHTLVDAAWLLQATAGDMYARGDKLEQFAFGQRVFGTRADRDPDAAAAVLREMPVRRMLLLGLERLGVTDPDVYAAGERQARAALEGGAERFWTLAQLQGAFALITRMSESGTLAREDAQALIQTLFAVPVAGGELKGAFAAWFESRLAPHLPRGATLQDRVIAALAGGATPGDPRVEWEGQTYQLDLAFAERRRIEQIRSHQDGPDLDLAIAIARLARETSKASSVEAATALVEEVQQLSSMRGPMLARTIGTALPAGVPVPRDGREWLAHAADELGRATSAGDLRRVLRTGDSLVALGDVVLGHAMLSLVYAVHLGDPNGPALLGANVALRHDFGFSRHDGEGRARGPWAQPRQDFQPGVPWHVVGSLIGLDVGLAPLALHRLSMDGLASPPKLQSIEREAFAVNVALLNPRHLLDPDRDRILLAIARGRARVRNAAADPAELLRVAATLELDGWRRRTVRWVQQNEPGSMENQFSLAELLTLGWADGPLNAWGASGLLSFGCVCTRFPEPRTWRILAGRTQLPMIAAVSVEMNLDMAQRLAALKLPAALLPSVLTTAMQDFVDQVDTADAGDQAAITRYAAGLRPDLVEDYIAATATLDGPLVSGEAGNSEP